MLNTADMLFDGNKAIFILVHLVEFFLDLRDLICLKLPGGR